MIANVQGSSNISHSLAYGQNPEKGGEVFLMNGTDVLAGPEQQARDWEAMSNDYKTKCYNIVISFSDSDSEKIRQIKDVGKRVWFERMVIRAFLDAMAEKGNNVYDCPFVAVHHGNTDNEHFHITVLTTTMDGRRMRDKFIKLNATRAAAKVSEQYGLEAAPKALRNERAHQEAVGKRLDGAGKDGTRPRRVHAYSRDEDTFMTRIRRREAVVRAEKRRKVCKFVIEKVAMSSTKDNFVDNLRKEGLGLFHDPKDGLYVVMKEDEREYSYLLSKNLGVDVSLLPAIDVNTVTRQRHPGKETDAQNAKYVTQKPAREMAVKAASNAIGRVATGIAAVSARLNVSSGSSSGQSQQGDQSHSGSYSQDDPDEEWKRRNGYHL